MQHVEETFLSLLKGQMQHVEETFLSLLKGQMQHVDLLKCKNHLIIFSLAWL
jgi:hypothetical protein